MENSRIIIKEIIYAGGACPFQVEAITNKGEEIYARYRWGQLQIEITLDNGDREVIFRKQIGKDQDDKAEIEKLRMSGASEEFVAKMSETFKNMRSRNKDQPLCFNGCIDMDEIRSVTEEFIEWPN